MCRAAKLSRPMIDLQSHSTVSDGQLEPGDVARSAAEAGVTVMSLTDHDGVAGVEEATRVANELGIENVPGDRDVVRPQVLRGPPHLRLLGRPRAGSPRPAPRPSRSASTGRRRSSPTSTRHGVEVTFEDAVAQAGAADAIGRPHIAKAAGAGPDLGPFFEEYLVPGREGVRLAQVADRRAGGRDDPRRRRASPSSPIPTGTSRTPSRSATWSRASSATSASTGSRPSTRRTPPSRPSTASSSARSSTWSRPARRTSTARPTRRSAAGARTTPTASASRRCPARAPS